VTRLDGKVAVVTGAAGGLGRAGAVLFAAEGARVVCVDVAEAGLAETVRQISASGGEALAVRTDVSRLAEVEAMVGDTLTAYDRIDVLWNNAAVLNGLYSSAEEITEAEWNAALAVTLTGAFFCIKAVVPHMKERGGGTIINTASVAGLVAHRVGRAAYVAAKGGLIALTRQLSLELGPHNIRVNAIAPGAIRTGMTATVSKPDDPTFDVSREEPVADAVRRAEPIEVARTALFLAGDDLGPMTGAILAHDGGLSVR
jgi:NAD(P)-dependent dehydrogenase (short-subunit alcohol dehydrogenase family)